MKYLFKTLIIFTIIFFALKLILFIFDTGHIVTYNVRNFKVKEELKVLNMKTSKLISKLIKIIINQKK